MTARPTTAAVRRARMVARLRAQGIADPRVLAAMAVVPRESFVPEALRGRAYEDERLPIGEGQTMSLPWTVARMCELLGAGPGSKLLEIGSGSGYHAAVLAAMGSIVFSVERHATLAREAATRLRNLGYLSVTVKHFDGSYGWGAQAPFAGILVTAAAPEIPSALVGQLEPGGRLVLPLARDPEGKEQRLVVVSSGSEPVGV
ncbi:MAG: protein-L-isoaspartate(D-aspartate) O-methyltransferase [Acidobacteria bacterium]|nr:protein-L-isoaspartate(D-aspartate) O-methyltransferase [Acidobacteriota bacterium]